MSARVAVVANAYGDPWDEEQVLAASLAGALACRAEVDILVPTSGPGGNGWDGPCRLLEFPGGRPDPARRWAWRTALLGDAELPAVAEEQIMLGEGVDSQALYRHLAESPYDAVVFVGCRAPATCVGMRSVPVGRRVVLAPASRSRTVRFRLHDETFGRPDRILATTKAATGWVKARTGAQATGRVVNVGFLVGVNPLASQHPISDRTAVVVPGDWTLGRPLDDLLRWDALLRASGGLHIRLVGPGADRTPLGRGSTPTRLDVNRAMHSALALLDPARFRPAGRVVLESFLLGTPVVVHAQGEATREHAESGGGGLWFSDDSQLMALVARLTEHRLRGALGSQGRAYAEKRFTDMAGYIDRVAAAVLA